MVWLKKLSFLRSPNLLVKSSSIRTLSFNMVMLLLCFTGLGLAGLSDAVRTNENADVTLQTLQEIDRDIDCSKMSPASTSATFGRGHLFGFKGNVSASSPDCDGKHFILDSYKKESIIVMDKSKSGTKCEAVGECRFDKSGPVWDYLRKMVIKECEAKLCRKAKKGSWFGNGWKEKGKSWRWGLSYANHPIMKRCNALSPCPEGVEDVFKRCWKGPKNYPKNYPDLLPEFVNFLDTSEFLMFNEFAVPGFNKTVCGCRSENDCTGS